MSSTTSSDEELVTIEPELEERILAEVDAVSDEMIEAIRQVVRQKSVQGEPAEGAPFGTDVRAALDQTLELCRELGFETTNVDGYMGYATWAGEKGSDGESVLPGYVCALGHLDVVPEGTTGWKVPPYSAHLEDGRITSRGVLDNKGPIYACLYALWALKRLGLSPRRDVRIIFGCNEETGFNDLRYSLEHEEAPVMGFTPDCKYPVVYAERGRMGVRLSARPGEGEGTDALLARFFSFMNEYVLNAKPNGERCGVDHTDEEFGVTEVRNYKLVLDEGDPAVEFAISYPTGITADELRERLAHARLHLRARDRQRRLPRHHHGRHLRQAHAQHRALWAVVPRAEGHWPPAQRVDGRLRPHHQRQDLRAEPVSALALARDTPQTRTDGT